MIFTEKIGTFILPAWLHKTSIYLGPEPPAPGLMPLLMCSSDWMCADSVRCDCVVRRNGRQWTQLCKVLRLTSSKQQWYASTRNCPRDFPTLGPHIVIDTAPAQLQVLAPWKQIYSVKAIVAIVDLRTPKNFERGCPTPKLFGSSIGLYVHAKLSSSFLFLLFSFLVIFVILYSLTCCSEWLASSWMILWTWFKWVMNISSKMLLFVHG